MVNKKETDKPTIQQQYSNFQIYITGAVFTLLTMFLLYISTSTLVSLINHKVAITSDYQYAKVAPFTVDETSFYMMLIFGILYSFVILHTIFSWINRVSWSRSVLYTVVALIPVGMVAYQYQSTDEFMYEPISSLYESSVKANPNFAQSPMGIKFSKALAARDYSTLKEISNNLDALKLMDFKSNKIIEIVDLLPLPQSVSEFKTMLSEKGGFVSLADYKAFYTALLVEFKASASANKKEFIFLIDMINPDHYYIPAS